MAGWGLFEQVLPVVEQTAMTVSMLFVGYLYVLAVVLAWMVRRAGQKD
ncbi:hypothetical protein [Haloarchaeobius sp. DFWS5]